MVTSKDKTTCDNEITDYTISSSTATKGTTCKYTNSLININENYQHDMNINY